LVLLFAHGVPPFRDASEMGIESRPFKGLLNIKGHKGRHKKAARAAPRGFSSGLRRKALA
jgi:hypothetical protein